MKDFIPHNYQSYCIDRVCDTPALGLFLDMGLGKTAITLSAIKRLKYEMWCVCKVLIIAPKKVAESVWSKEAAKWKQLKDLRFSFVLGSADQRRRALEETADIYLINRENTQWLVSLYGHNWPFDMVVLDESSSFSHPPHGGCGLKSVNVIRNIQRDGLCICQRRTKRNV